MPNNKTFLTILVPTRNRAKDLNNAIRRIVRSIEFAKSFGREVELVVVNNSSTDNTEEVARSWESKYPYIKYYKHKEDYQSAEESLCHGMKYANGEFIWSFGDDDFMETVSVLRLVKVLATNRYDLVIQNVKFIYNDDFEKKSYHYIPSEKYKNKIIEYKTHNLFKDFGFHHITAGFSAACFRKEKFNMELFLKLMDTSKIYSYSVAIFASFCRAKAAFLPEAKMTTTMNIDVEEFNRIASLAVRNGFLSFYSWSNGFLRLMNIAAKEANFSVSYFTPAREIRFSRRVRTQEEGFLITDLIRTFFADVINLKYRQIYKYKTRIAALLRDYKEYFSAISNENHKLKFFSKRLDRMLKIFERNDVVFSILFFYYCRKFKRILYKMRNYKIEEELHSIIAVDQGKNGIELDSGIALHYNGAIRNID